MPSRTVTGSPFGSRMRELREQRGLSLRALERRVLSSKSRLHEYERGLAMPPADVIDRLDEVLDTGGELAALASASRHVGYAAEALEFPTDWRRAVEIANQLWQGDVQRRDVLRGAGFAAAAFLTPAMRAMGTVADEHPVGGGRREVDEAHVETVRRMTATFRTLDNEFGGGSVRDVVVRFLHREVAPLLLDGSYNERVGRHLFSATAELTQLGGWAAYDAGLHGLAQRYMIQALRLAVTAADRPMGAEILAAMSHQAAYLRAPAEAVDLARASARLAADGGVEAILAEAAVLEAHGYALAGEEHACTRALDRAEKTLDRADRQRDPQWIGYFDEAYLSAKFGHCFTALARGDLARRFAERSLDMDGGKYVRGRQFNLALLATAHAQNGEVERAGAVGLQAVDLAERLRSQRSKDYLRDLANRLGRHVGLGVVDDFMERARPTLGS